MWESTCTLTIFLVPLNFWFRSTLLAMNKADVGYYVSLNHQGDLKKTPLLKDIATCMSQSVKINFLTPMVRC